MKINVSKVCPILLHEYKFNFTTLGLSWGTSAISNAAWTGVKLSDVLAAAGAKEEEVEHVHLQGRFRILSYTLP